MTIVDAHVHMGLATKPAFGTATDYTADQVLRQMERAGVDMSLTMPIPHIQDNDYIIASWRAHPDRFIPWAYVDPWHHPDPRQSIRHLAEEGFCGIKLRAVSLRYALSDLNLLGPILNACHENSLVVSMHTGDDPSATPLQVGLIAEHFAELTVVLIHGGMRMLAMEAIEVARRYPNVYLDETAGSSWQLREAARVLGPGRLMYGSDSPFMDTRVEQVKVATAIEDPAARAEILGGTAMRVFGLRRNGT